MKVLQICHKPPLPAVDGGCKAMNNITQGLLDLGISVRVVTLATHKHPFIDDALSQQYKNQTKIEQVTINTRIKVKDAFLNIFSTNSYNISRFYNKDFEKLILKKLKAEQFDVVLFESLFVAPYYQIIRKKSKAKLIYRAHNIEHEIWQRNALQEKGVKKKYMKLLSKRLKNYELEMVKKFDGVAAITAKDAGQLLKFSAKNMAVFPYGIEAQQYPLKMSIGKSLFYIGSMDWLPNLQGMRWLMKEVMPLVIKKDASIKLTVAGRGMPQNFLQHKQKGIKIIGEVEDAQSFIAKYNIMVVPLFAGSGMRIKIVEAMAMGKMIIATSVALEGIYCQDKKNVVVANTVEEFVEAILYYCQYESEQSKIAQAGLELIKKEYDNQIIVTNLVKYFKAIV